MTSVLFGLAGCPFDCDDEDCPDAPEAFAASTRLHEELVAAFPFDTEWEVRLSHVEERQPHLEDSLMPISYEYDFGRHARVDGTLTLVLPSAPEALSCDDVVAVQDAVPSDTEFALQLYYATAVSGWDRLPPLDGEPLCATFAPPGLESLYCSTSWSARLEGPLASEWEVGGEREFTHCMPTFFAITCCLPSPCPFRDKTGCDGQNSHQLGVWLGIDLNPEGSTSWTGAPSLYELDLPAIAPELGHLGTQPWLYCDFPPRREMNECMIECAQAGDGSLCCVDACLDYAAIDQTDTFSCNVGLLLPELAFAPVEGAHVLSSEQSGLTREHSEVTLHCTSGCECDGIEECDDDKECTRDECVRGNCEYIPDDNIEPTQVEGDCRACEDGEVTSVREPFEAECERIRQDALETCPTGGDNWRVHWVQEINDVETQYHYCAAGESPASAAQPICLGAGECSSGAPVTSLSGQHSAQCRSYDGQELEFACDVLCTICR